MLQGKLIPWNSSYIKLLELVLVVALHHQLISSPMWKESGLKLAFLAAILIT